MERENILRFAAKSFDDFPDGFNIVELEQFSRLVEQETLERAANVCEPHLDYKEQERADDEARKSEGDTIAVQLSKYRHASDVGLYNCGIEKCIESIRNLNKGQPMTKNELMELAETEGMRRNFAFNEHLSGDECHLIAFANAILERAAVELSTYGVIQDMGGADAAEIVRSLKLPTN